jgi:HEAT repeat protein
LHIHVQEDVAESPAPANDPLLNLKKALASGENKSRHTAVMDLIEMGPNKARPALQQVLTCLARPDNSRPLREDLLALVKELLQTDDQNAIPVLRETMQDKDGLIRRQAALALLKLGDSGITTALPALREILADGDSGDRRVAVVALRKVTSSRGGPSVLAPAIPELLAISATEEDEEIRLSAQSVADSLARNSKKGLMLVVDVLADGKQKEAVRLQAAAVVSRQKGSRLSDTGVRELRQRLAAIAADADAPQRVRDSAKELVKKFGN